MTRKYIDSEINYLAKLVNESSDAIYSRGVDQKILSWNKGAEILFGHTKHEAIGKTSNQLGIYKLTDTEIIAIKSKIIVCGTWKYEMDFYNNEGKHFIGSVTGNLIKDEADKIIAFYFVVKDITAQKEQEHELREENEFLEARNFINTKELHDSEDIYKNIFENSPIPMWIYNPQTLKFLEVNELATIEYGYSKEEFLAMTLMDIQPKEQKELFLKFVKNNNDENLRYKIDYAKHKNKDGTVIDVEITSHHIIYAGSKARLVLANNITKRKAIERELAKSEKLFRAMIENSNDAFTLMDQSLNAIFRSNSTTRITGWTDEDMIGQNATIHIHPDDLPYISEMAKTVLANPGKKIPTSYRNLHKDGQYRWMEGTVINLLNDENVKSIISNYNDITERKIAEEKLQSSELRYRTLLENGNDVVTLFDEKFNVIYRSPSSERITGWTDEDMFGKSGLIHVHPEDEEKAKSVVAQILINPNSNYNVTIRLMNKNGHYIWVDGLIINLLKDDKVNAIVFNFRDISEKKENEEKLASSELRFRTLLENGNDIVAMFDQNFNIIYRSPSATKVLGWTDEDMIGQKGNRNSHPDDMDNVQKSIRMIMENPGIPQNVTFRMLHKNGHYIWVEGLIINLLNDKNIHAIVFNFRDITEFKLATDDIIAREYQYRNLINRISDGFIALDNNACITYINKVAEKLFNREEGYLIGKSLQEEFNDKIEHNFYNAIRDSIETQRPSSLESYSVKLQKWVSCILYPSESGVSCFIRDFTEKKKLEQKLKEQEHQEQSRLISAALEAQEKERNAIGLELHDNVNQILVGTTMLLSVIKNKEEKDDNLLTDCIEHIKKAINENRKIAHTLVAPDIDHKSLFNQIQDLAVTMLHSAGISTIIFNEDLDETLLTKDYIISIYRILQEQFTNIAKHASATNVVIQLSTPDASSFVMKVTDDGIGMDTEMVKKGIGLRNINSRLSVLNGNMKIDTKPGRGFTMEIWIPLLKNN